MTVHGGDVWHLGIPASEILDFSANINPRGLPPRAFERLQRDASNRQLLSFYPDRSASRLRNALSRKLDIPPESIVIGSGAESLLAPILRCLQPKRVLVPVPAFSEYRRVCDFIPFPLSRAEAFRMPVDRLCAQPADLVLLNNPHNPTGAMLEADEVRQIADAHPLLLDEAFIDYAPHASLVHDAPERQSLIVIRSLTKFYGCPALRIGYAVARPDMAQRIADLLPTWPVTQLAIDALAEAITDDAYAQESLHENAIEREALASALRALGLFVFPSAANYLFIELNEPMPELRTLLIAKHRILIRNCDSYENLEAGRYIRVAVRSHDDNAQLVSALHDLLRLD
jgi:threonine-phosphate decarboxylase